MVPADTGPRTYTVVIVNDGWHTSIVIPRTELIATGMLPEIEDFPGASFLEFGWGDRAYFPAEEETLGMALEAALTPTQAIIHVAALPWAPDLIYTEAEVLQVHLTQDGFRLMVRSIASYFERPIGRPATPVLPGFYPESRFYNAHGTFHLFNTCNTWTARMLRAGGVNLSPAGIVTAEDLMLRLRVAVTLALLSPG